MAFSAGALLKKQGDVVSVEENKVAETEKSNAAPRQYRPVETLSLLEGWRRIEAGQVDGAFFLEVMEPMQYTWGPRVIVTDRDRGEVREQFPEVLIFTPPEFQEIIKDWPESEGAVLALRVFKGALIKEVIA